MIFTLLVNCKINVGLLCCLVKSKSSLPNKFLLFYYYSKSVFHCRGEMSYDAQFYRNNVRTRYFSEIKVETVLYFNKMLCLRK